MYMSSGIRHTFTCSLAVDICIVCVCVCLFFLPFFRMQSEVIGKVLRSEKGEVGMQFSLLKPLYYLSLIRQMQDMILFSKLTLIETEAIQ